jgi:hypothetical protein
MKRRTLQAREGKAYLIYFIRHHAQTTSATQLYKVVDALNGIVSSAQNQSIQLKFQRRDLEPDALPIDIDGPEAGVYLRLRWVDDGSTSTIRERIVRDIKECFEQAKVEAKDVTADLDRIFLLVFDE